MSAPVVVIIAVAVLCIGWYLGFKDGFREGLNVQHARPKVEETKPDPADWWKDNDRPQTNL